LAGVPSTLLFSPCLLPSFKSWRITARASLLFDPNLLRFLLFSEGAARLAASHMT
jgi:hypothetical protein